MRVYASGGVLSRFKNTIAYIVAVMALVLTSVPGVGAVDPTTINWQRDLGVATQYGCEWTYGIGKVAGGNLYVGGTAKVYIYDASGNYVSSFGSIGTGNGQFVGRVEGIAIMPGGDVLVVNNNRVQRFSPTGAYLSQWGSPGSGNGQFSFPGDLATDSSGNIYVADNTNHRVQKFDSTGTFITAWGSFGTANGAFNSPRGITVDAAGNVYVADSSNQRIQKFTNTGTFITKFGTSGSGPGQLNYPKDVTVTPGGQVYVTDSLNSRLSVFDTSGNYVAQFGSFGGATNELSKPSGITVDSTTGIVYVADTDNSRVQVFSTSPTTYNSTISLRDVQTPCTPTNTSTAADGSIYVSGFNAFVKYDVNGQFLQNMVPRGIAGATQDLTFPLEVAPNGDIYYASYLNPPLPIQVSIKRVQSNGTYVSEFGSIGSGNGQFDYFETMTIAANGDIYVADEAYNRVQVFDANGTYLRQFGTSGSGNGQFNNPRGIAVAANGNIYVSDYNNRVQVFDANGTFLRAFGSSGTGNGQFSYPEDLAVDQDGFVYVLDVVGGNGRIQIFDTNDVYQRTISGYGPSNTAFGNRIEAIHFDRLTNRLFAVNNGRHLTHVFAAPTLPWSPTSAAASTASSGVAVSWQPPTFDGNTPLTGYDIYYRLGTTGAWVLGTSVNNTTHQATLTGLSAGDYQVRVLAKNIVGSSQPAVAGASVTIAGTTASPGTTLLAETGQRLWVGLLLACMSVVLGIYGFRKMSRKGL